jgi:pimeloyl-ACP methyl ester carboxylesterase
MQGKLINVTTSDGIQLHGFLALPSACTEVWLMVHGVNSNFYSSSLLTETAHLLHQHGYGVALVNTRGHDILSFNTGTTPVRIGSQIEMLGSCEQDLSAWAQSILATTNLPVSLLGHSLGAVKSIYYLSLGKHCISRWIALSPPRLNTQSLMLDEERGDAFREHLQHAQEFCDSGKPDHVMKVRFPMPMWICAATYLDKYGSQDKFDYLRTASDVTQPGLWTFGEQEVRGKSASFRDAHLHVNDRVGKGTFRNQQIVVIPGADHSYRGKRDELFASMLRWLKSD